MSATARLALAATLAAAGAAAGGLIAAAPLPGASPASPPKRSAAPPTQPPAPALRLRPLRAPLPPVGGAEAPPPDEPDEQEPFEEILAEEIDEGTAEPELLGVSSPRANPAGGAGGVRRGFFRLEGSVVLAAPGEEVGGWRVTSIDTGSASLAREKEPHDVLRLPLVRQRPSLPGLDRRGGGEP